jgi:hypothetical protein
MSYTYGLTKIEIADILGDGGPGTSFTQIGYTNPGTTKFTTDKGTANEKRCEELATPLVSIPGDQTITVDTQVIINGADVMATFLGGTSVAGVWSAPDSQPVIEKTVKITPLAGMTFQINRASIEGGLNGAFAKDGDLFCVDVSFTVLQPEKEGTARMTATEPV